MRQIHGDDARRVWSKLDVDPEGCWTWTGTLNNQGYGVVRIGGRSGRLVRVHRWVFERIRGEIPAGLTLDHLCHNDDPACLGGPTCEHRRCVNPSHLEPVTDQVNIARSNAWSRRRARQEV